MKAIKHAVIYNVCSEYPDPAIDISKSNAAEYLKSFNPMHLSFIEGAKPVKFTVKRLSPTELSAVNKSQSVFGAEIGNINAIGYGLIAIENQDGTIREIEREDKKVEGVSVSLCKNLNQLTEELSDEFGFDILSELGISIVKISRMPLNLSPFLSK